MTGDDPRLSVSEHARLLLRQARRDPALFRRTDSDSMRPPVIVPIRDGLPMALQPFAAAAPVPSPPLAEQVRRVADDTLRVAVDTARQAEEAARLADQAGRTARSGTLAAAGCGMLAAVFCLALVAAGQINAQTNADLVKVNAALRQLNVTQHQIAHRLAAGPVHDVTPATLIVPAGRAAAPVAPTPATATRIGPAAAPIATTPLPPTAASVAGGPTARPTPAGARGERVRADQGSSPGVAMANGSEGNSS